MEQQQLHSELFSYFVTDAPIINLETQNMIMFEQYLYREQSSPYFFFFPTLFNPLAVLRFTMRLNA